jgi:polyhydroxybutyrate depolymerase
MRRIFVLILLLVAGLPVQAQTSLEERGYGVYVPRSYTGEALPLVIALHGAGDDYVNFARATGLIALAEEQGFVVAFPNAYLREWNDGSPGQHYEDDVALLLELIETIAEQINLDRQRLYLLGFSNGAMMTFRAVCEAPGVFAAVVSIAGGMRFAQDCTPEAHSAIMVIHGTTDAVVPFAGGSSLRSAAHTVAYWVDLNQCGDQDVMPFDPERFQQGVGIYFYDECEQGDLVLLYALENFGHVYPGVLHRARNELPPFWLDASSLAWNFFQLSYVRQQEARTDSPQAEATAEATAPAD